MVRKHVIAPIARDIMRTICGRDIPLGICERVIPRERMCDYATIISRVIRRGVINRRGRYMSATEMRTAEGSASSSESVRLHLRNYGRARKQRQPIHFRFYCCL
jgi:hypothetical protein